MSQTATSIAPGVRRVMQTGSASMWQLTRNELFKLRKWRLVWAMLALDLLLVVAAWLVAVLSPDAFQAGHPLSGPDALAFAIGQPMTLGRRAGEFLVAALGALAFGGEFSTGAIRLVLSRGVHRRRYLAAKLLALALACVALTLAGMFLSALLSSFLPLIHQPAPALLNVDGRTLGILAWMSVGTLENYLFCLLLGAALGVLSRSGRVGVLASCAWLVGEDILARLLSQVGQAGHPTLGQQLVGLLYTPNLNAFYAHALPGFLSATLDSLDGMVACNPAGATCAPVSPAHALLVPLVWALALGGAAAYLFVKRDVTR